MPQDTVKELRRQRGQLEHRMRALVDTADAENRDLNAEENAEYDRLINEDNGLRSRIERHDRLNEIRSDLDRVPGTFPASTVRELRDGGDITDETRSLAFQAWVMNEARMNIPERNLDACRRLNVRHDLREFEAPLAETHEFRSLQDQYRTVHPSLITRSLNVTAGADVIPQGFVSAFEQKLLAVGGMLQVIGTVRTETGNALPWPVVDDTSNEGEIIGEETDYGASTDPTVTSVTLGAYKFSSKPVLVSRELIEDSAIGLAELLGELLGERIGRHFNKKLTVGTGTAEPNGLTTAATVGKTTASATAIATDELIDLIHSVDPAYRGNARFMLNDSIIAYLRKLKDSDGNYLWQPGLVAGVPDRLLGFQVTMNQHMASSVATGNKTIAFGDFTKYKARVVRGVRMKHLVERYAEFDQEAFIGYLRADGDLLNTAAIKVLQQL